MKQNKKHSKVIIDTDISIGQLGRDVDDGLALALALNSPELQIIGITINFGNTTCEKAEKIAKNFLKIYGREDIPVFPGAKNKNDLGKITSAVDFILQTLKTTPVEIIGIAPLTNLASVLFLLRKEYRKNLKALYLMGGAVWCKGNIPPLFSAEFNIFNDPIAAKVVFSSNIPVYLISLDITSKIVFDRELLNLFKNSSKNEVKFLYKNIKIWYYLNYLIYRGFLLHDVIAVMASIEKDLLKYEHQPLYVVDKGLTKGKIVRLKPHKNLHNIAVGKEIRKNDFREFFKKRLL